MQTDEHRRTPRAPSRDPRARLSPTALRVLEAARRVIVEEGFEKLTLSRIGEVSGEKNVAAVKYYFGSKSGLVSVVLDTVLYDAMSTLDAPPGDEFCDQGLTGLTVQTAIVNQPSDALTILFEMLPHVLRDEGARRPPARLLRGLLPAASRPGAERGRRARGGAEGAPTSAAQARRDWPLFCRRSATAWRSRPWCGPSTSTSWRPSEPSTSSSGMDCRSSSGTRPGDALAAGGGRRAVR